MGFPVGDEDRPFPKRGRGRGRSEPATSRGDGLDWRWFIAAALLSTVTMPITAIIFLAVGGFIVGVTTLTQVLRRDPTWTTGQLAGLGLLVGPGVYLALALLG